MVGPVGIMNFALEQRYKGWP